MSESKVTRLNGLGTAPTGEWLPLREAAERLGVSLDSMRRRLRTNSLRARQEPILGGHRWLVWVDGDACGPDANGVAPPPYGGGAMGMADRAPPQAESASSLEDEAESEPASPAPAQDPPGNRDDATPTPRPAPAEALVAAQRAEEMARYSAALLEPWRQRVEELSRENGRLEERAEHLQTELEQIRTQLAEATASKEPPETENAPQAEWPGGRRWWQRLLWG